MNLLELDTTDARLVQYGLEALGFYTGTKRGLPAGLTLAAYERYRASAAGASPATQGLAPGESISDRLIRILVAEDGVLETPKDSNRGKRVQEYQAATNLKGTGWPWCAAFICWGLLQVQGELPLPFERPQTAAAFGFEEWARKQSLTLIQGSRDIRKGDIVIFSYSHIGLATADANGSTVETVEGNTDPSGGREGGGVYANRHRPISSVRSHIRLIHAA